MRITSESRALFEEIILRMPRYLSAQTKEELFCELARLRDDWRAFNYFWMNPDASEALQGDVWRSFIVSASDGGPAQAVQGIVLSNSCDIDPTNNPLPEQNILFAPLHSLDSYRASLRRRGKSEQQVESEIQNIRWQMRTDALYLPAHRDALIESIAFLDEVHPNPLSHFLKNKEQRLAALSQTGHYLFLFKLATHLCRLQENVERNSHNETGSRDPAAPGCEDAAIRSSGAETAAQGSRG